jgi:hypothetical protein
MKDLAAIIKKIDGIDIDIQKSGVSIKDILRRLVS